MYALLCERVYNCHLDNDTITWLQSRCLEMDCRSDSDIPAFGCMPQYILLHALNVLEDIFLEVFSSLKRIA
jgi:hypothetical protein